MAPDQGDMVFQTPYLTAILKPPARYDSSRTYPLLVALHGNGGAAAAFAPSFSPVARASFFVAVPQGQYAREDGGFSWFNPTSDRTLWEVFDAQTVTCMVGLIEALRASYPIGKVFVFGLSQGASLTYMTGLLHPTLVSGILAIAGSLPLIDTVGAIVHAQDIENARGVPVFVARGTDDGLVSRGNFLGQVDFWTSHGYSVTAYEFHGGHTVTSDVVNRALVWLREEVGR